MARRDINCLELSPEARGDEPASQRSAAGARRAGLTLGIALAVLLAGQLPVAAQQTIPGNAVPQGSPIPRILPPEPPSVGPGLALPGPAAQTGNVPDATVGIRQVTVQGATAYKDPDLAALTPGLTGAAVPLARIEAARLAILNRYRADGYVLTTVNAAVDAAGTLRFSVVEGHIASVRLDGDIGPAGTQVLRFLNRLTAERPVGAAAIERWLLLAQDVPGVTMHAVLRPDPQEPGALTLVAQVERQPVSGLLTADNRGFRFTGPQQGLLVADLNSFTEFGERTEFTLYRSARATQTFGQASEEFFAGSSGLKIRLYGGSGYAAPSDALRVIGYSGSTTTFGVGASYPLIRSRQQTLNLTAALDAIQTEIWTDVVPGSEASIRRSRDSLRVARLGTNYAYQDFLFGAARPAVDAAELRLSQGIPGLGGSGNDNPLPTRPGERVDFTKLSGEISRTQTLFSPWPDATVALKAMVTGQFSNDVLPAVEKFFLGGPVFTRGFYAGEVTGDNALATTLELQLNTGFDLALMQRRLRVGAQFYAFYDRGWAWQNAPAEPDLRLSSEGVGVRLALTRFTEFGLEGVVRNTRPSEGTGFTRPLKADALYWRVLARF